MLNKRFYTAFFNADGNSAGAPGNAETTANEPQSHDANKTAETGEKAPQKGKDKPDQTPKYTDADIDRIIDSKFAKWQAQKAKEEAEAAKLADMNAEEKAQHARKQAEERATKAEAALARYEMAGEARAMLADKNLNVGDDLLNMLITTEAETTKKNVDAFTTAFTAAVDAEVKRRMAGTTPKASAKPHSLTKEDINKIKDPVERQKAISENLDLFIK